MGHSLRRASMRGGLLAAILGLAAGLTVGLGWARHAGSAADSHAAAAPDAADDQLYTCGMHPQVIQKGPGNCPICGMQLTPLKDTQGQSGSTGVSIDPVVVQNMGIRTAPVRQGPLVQTIRTVGRVDYNEELLSYVNTKYAGWIEALHVNQTGVYVRKGQPLFDVYSRDVYSAQEEFLTAVRSAGAMVASAPGMRDHANNLIEAARKKLRLFDISDEQIDELAKADKSRKAMTVFAPANGIVTEKEAIVGMYIEPGTKAYTIADLSRVWVYVSIYEYELPWVRVGQAATMRLPYIPGKEFVGKVVYIYPYLEEQTRVIRVRLEFENPELELKPEMYANVTLRCDLQRDALLIPREAYIDSGVRKVAFVATGEGRFEPRELTVGVEAEDGMVEVRNGVKLGDTVVVSGQFLLDAESKLREAILKMSPLPHHHGEGTPAKPAAKAGPPASQPHEAWTGMAYACPMDEHPAEQDPSRRGPYFSTAPGECPYCGMKLKPSAELDWTAPWLAEQTAATQPGEGSQAAVPKAYACPMHPHVQSDQPGLCSICAMNLVPTKDLHAPQTAPARVERDLEHLLEHYLEIQRLLASDSTTHLASNALGMAAASEALVEHASQLEGDAARRAKSAAEQVHNAAVKFTGERIGEDRVQLVDLSAGMVKLLEEYRPDRQRRPKLYIFHCPMSKGDWIQTSEDKANPYYGFQMLKCGELRATK